MDSIDMLINELQSLALQAKKVPFSNTDIMLNKSDLIELVSRFRESYPQIIRESNQVVKERDEILKKAEKYANETMDAAEAHAKNLVTNTEIMKKAEADALIMRQEAEENYRKLDYEARSLAYNILDKAEQSVKEGLSIINDRKRKLIED